MAQSGAEFVDDGEVTTYKDNTATKEFAYDDTITVKATPTGSAPTRAAVNSWTAPGSGEMAVYYHSAQVSEAAGGSYTMTVSVRDLVTSGAPCDRAIPLTAIFVETTPMSEGSDTVDVTLKKKELTIDSATLAAKTCDRLTTATVDTVTLTGLVDGESLTLGTDCTATAQFTDANAGTGKSVTVKLNTTGKAANHTLSSSIESVTGIISPKEVTNPIIIVIPNSYTYTGKGITPTNVEVKDGEDIIPTGEYTVGYSDNTNAGDANVTITDNPDGNYTVNGSTIFQITKAQQAPLIITGQPGGIVYGDKFTPGTSGGSDTQNRDADPILIFGGGLGRQENI